MPRPLPLVRAFVLTRSSPFAFACGQCSRCCHGKVIPINPYEVARLADYLRISTTELLATRTSTGGATLRARDDGTCVFLGERGCTVHAARPLACRLYPLGRHITPSGDERFAELVPHPQSEGTYGGPGTVADWLLAQGAGPWIDASDRYFAVLRRLMRVLAAQAGGDEVSGALDETMQRAPRPDDENLLDVDAIVSSWCAEHGEAFPEEVERRVSLHLRILEAIGAGPIAAPNAD